MFFKWLPSLGCIALCCFVGCSTPTKEDEVKPLQGIWEGTHDGSKSTKHVVIDKDTFQIVDHGSFSGGGTLTGAPDRSTFRVNNEANPAHLDVIILEGPHQGKTRLGIFNLEGDKLHLSLGAIGAPRPGDFSKSSKATVMVLHRKK